MKSPHILIVEGRFYEDLADEMARGAIAELETAGATYKKISVPGALEIPAIIALASSPDARLKYDGYVALGCVIRGETTHYDIVASESARGLMDLAIQRQLAIGNGILTVENFDQAWARAKVSGDNKGGGAVRAALQVIAIRRHMTGSAE